MPKQNVLVTTWITLVGLTVISASFAESTEISNTVAVLVCMVTSYKGWLVINNLMDLRFAVRRLRWMMLGYFLILMPIILLVIFFPDGVRQLTTL